MQLRHGGGGANNIVGVVFTTVFYAVWIRGVLPHLACTAKLSANDNQYLEIRRYHSKRYRVKM